MSYNIQQLIEINTISGIITVIISIVTIPIEYRFAVWSYNNIWLVLKNNIRYMIKHPYRFWILGRYRFKGKYILYFKNKDVYR